MTTPAAEFAHTLARHAPRYGVALTAAAHARLTAYYELVSAWNARLHLVAPCPPHDFATRHVLESLTAAPHLPPAATVADVGSGAGLPLVPCLIARPDLRGIFIEANQKKAVFLREALRHLELRAAAEVRAVRFEQTPAPAADFITCRALERFTALLPQLGAWAAPAATLLLFGGPTLRARIEQLGWPYQATQLPASEQRFLFVVRRAG